MPELRDPRLLAWMRELITTPGLTAIKDFEEAWREHVARSLAAFDVIRCFEGPIVDVGSGGGSPGIPLAAAFPEREVTLLESQKRKGAFLKRIAPLFPNVRVVVGRAEEQDVDRFGIAVARALAPPPVAAEWCLPLVRPEGAVVLYVGESTDKFEVARVAARIGGGTPRLQGGLLVIPKLNPTPKGFPRRTGVARKRPLTG